MAALAVDRRREEDEEELFGLYRDVFGHEMTEASRRRWAWQYRDNPRSDGAPEIWVAREGARILGQYASMPVRLWWGDREVRASWGMDVFLREEVRGQGVGALLFDTWSQNVDVALGLGLTTSSYNLFQKLGYRDVGPVPFYRKILDPAAVLARRVGRAATTIAGPLLGAALRSLNPDAPSGGAARQALLSAVLADFRQARVARAQAFSLHAGLGNEMLRRGFSRGPSPMQFCVRSRAGGNEVLADPGRWHVVFGDSDMDR